MRIPRGISFYILREFATAASFTFTVSIVLFIVAIVLRFLHEFPQSVGFELLHWMMILVVYTLPYTLPLTLAIGAVISLSRLYEYNEIFATMASGVRPSVLAFLPVLIGGLFTIWLYAFNDRIHPIYQQEKNVEAKRLSLSVAEQILPHLVGGNSMFRGCLLAGSEVVGSEVKDLVLARSDTQTAVLLFAKSGRFEVAPMADVFSLELLRGELCRLDLRPGA